MKKPIIKRLCYPIWFRIIFFVLTIITPIALIMIEGYQSEYSWFRWTFGVITALVIFWAFLKHFIINKWETKIYERQNKLEHDYEIDVGDSQKIKWIWFTQEQKIAIFNAINCFLYGGLFSIIIAAANTILKEINTSIIIIAISYIIAYMLKFITITVLKGADKDYE